MRSSMSWEDLWPLLLQGTVDTVYMVGLAALFTVLLGLPTGVLLFVSRRNGLAPMPKLNAVLGAIINFGRSLPFIVLLIALIPFTRLIIGTTLAPLFRFKDEADVIAQANDTEFGLAAYFYARDLGRVFRVGEALEYGIIGINTGLISTEVAPFGGVKSSGLGREGSKYGIEDYLEIKYMCIGI